MVEIKKLIKIFFSSIFFLYLAINFSSANIYQTNCKTVERKNNVKSLSFVFSFKRGNIVINQINKKNAKYKIKISNILDEKKFLFNAEDKFFKLEFKPGYSYLKKNYTNTQFDLVSGELTGININCSYPKLIKSEAVSAELVENDKNNLSNNEQIKKILDQLQSGKEIDKSNLNQLMSSLQENNNQSDIDISQLQGLLQSQSFISQLTKGNLLNKLSSEEFLKMIIEEFKKFSK